MLKSTHKPAAPPEALPEGWTAHKAPTGHTYYYNSSTKQSTYKRPSIGHEPPKNSEPLPPVAVLADSVAPVGILGSGSHQTPEIGDSIANQRTYLAASQQPSTSRPEPKDRPKAKLPIPGAAPWLLVRTKLNRRFVFNPELNESFWKFPPEVLKCVVELDRKERDRKERRERGEPSDTESDTETNEYRPKKQQDGEDSDEYEEVEVTDDEDDGNSPKRLRVEEDKPQGPVEFDEDDIAYQLAAMGQEYDQEDLDDFQSALEVEDQLGIEDANALFSDLLDDFHINPYTPWETIIEEGMIIDDERYLCLSNMRSRKGAWEAWSRERIKGLKEKRAAQEKKDPRIPYIAFLQENATPKLYWPEFKRKFRKEPAMRDNKIAEKDKEKWYREHINRIKLPEGKLKSDLTTLLKSLPIHLLNRSTSLSMLPSDLLTDLRYISLRPSVRDPLIEAYIQMQPPAPQPSDISPEEEAEATKKRLERERRERALQDRERHVGAQRRERDFALRASKGALKASEAETERALQVGKEGLLGHLEKESDNKTVD